MRPTVRVAPYSDALIMYPNGTLSAPAAPISIHGNTFVLTGNITGELVDERNGSTLDGAGFAVRASDSAGYTCEPLPICKPTVFAVILEAVSAVTVENLTVSNGTMLVSQSQNVTLSGVSNPTGLNITIGLWVQSTNGLTVDSSRFLERNSSFAPEYPANAPYVLAGGEEGMALGVEASGGVRVTNSYLSGLIGALFADVQGLVLANDTLNGTVAGIAIPPRPTPPASYPPAVAAGTVAGGIRNPMLWDDNASAPALGTEFYTVPGAIVLTYSTNFTVESCRWLGKEPVGLFVLSSANGTIANNDGDRVNGASFEILNGQHFLLERNNASHAPLTSDAFELSAVSYATLLANNASETGTGVSLLSSYSVRLINNSFPFDTSQALSLQSDDLCVVTGNDLTGSSVAGADGIFINNSTRLAIANNTIGAWSGNGSEAVDAFDLRDSTLEYNLASGASVGMALSASFDDTVRGNQIQRGGNTVGDAGVQLDDSGSLTIVANTFQFDRIGLLGTGGGDTQILGNNFSFDTAQGIRWSSFDNLTVAHNVVVDDGAGIDLVDGAHYTLAGNTASNLAFACSTCVGILLGQLSDGSIVGNNLSSVNLGVEGSFLLNLSVRLNTIYETGFGILLGGATNLTVADNRGGNDLGGVEVDDSRNVLLRNNSFSGDIAEGFELINAVNATLDANSAVNSGGDGIALWSSSDLTLTNNSLVGDLVGLRAENSTDLLVEANSVGRCNVSFRLNSVLNATFFHNNFEEDSNWSLLGNTSGLRWDAGYPFGGNFWSNATGTDVSAGPGQDVPGADGILDQSFGIVGFGVDHYPLAVPWAAPSIEFVAQGLPAGTSWSVVLTYAGALGGAGSVTLTGSGSSATGLLVPYGAWVPFSYRIGFVAGFVPAFRTGGQNTSSSVVTVTLLFSPFLVPLAFNESGLAAGTNWSVSVGGHVLSGSTAWLNISLSNGTYAYSVLPVPGYYGLPSGIVGLSGTAVAQPLVFLPATFLLFFVESGLPNGTPWSLTFRGIPYTVTVPELSFSVPNGSYTYSVAPSTIGYARSPANGSARMAGFPLVVRIGFESPPAPAPPSPPPPSHELENALAALAILLGLLAIAGWFVAARRRRVGAGTVQEDSREDVGAEPEQDDLMPR
ncbi:MAG: right-handed parallel beta-helix repeat-containing protein [Thermoplasmata archaeon]|nr:right-handed parallel beta-helix repeat-containing protein [Thermoplasmata archaeon]MCI4341282.1 right-handed parallel beta-helix repeat-containing protein [Thermoplasmata archaeon]